MRISCFKLYYLAIETARVVPHPQRGPPNADRPQELASQGGAQQLFFPTQKPPAKADGFIATESRTFQAKAC